MPGGAWKKGKGGQTTPELHHRYHSRNWGKKASTTQRLVLVYSRIFCYYFTMRKFRGLPQACTLEETNDGCVNELHTPRHLLLYLLEIPLL